MVNSNRLLIMNFYSNTIDESIIKVHNRVKISSNNKKAMEVVEEIVLAEDSGVISFILIQLLS